MHSGKHFISYSRKNSEFVKKLAIDLKKSGEDVWLNQLDIAPGVPWDECIQNALTEAEGVIVVLSNDFVKSANVMDEVSYAISHGKKVVPLMIETCTIPLRLARLHYIDFTTNYEAAFDQLLNALNASEPTGQSPAPNIKEPSKTAAQKDAFKKIVPVVAVLVALAIVFSLFKKGNNTNETIGETTTSEQHNTLPQPEDKQNKSSSTANDVSASTNINPSATTDRVNLLDPAAGSEILVASSDDLKYSIDGKEDVFSFNKGEEAVFGFKDNKSGTFDTFTVLIAGSERRNIKQFELFTGNDSPTGSFQSLGKYQTQNLKLFKTPYQPFTFPEVTAMYFKVKFIDTHGDYGWGHAREIQLFGKLK